MKKLQLKKGLTLLELLMAVGIAALIAIVALTFFNQTSDATKVSNEVKNLGSLASGVNNAYASQRNYAGLNNTVILLTNAVPDVMRGPTANDIAHGWLNTGVTIAPFTDVSPDDQFTVTYAAVPPGPCVDLATKTVASFDSLDVNGNPITAGNEVALATAACNLAANVMVWTSN